MYNNNNKYINKKKFIYHSQLYNIVTKAKKSALNAFMFNRQMPKMICN